MARTRNTQVTTLAPESNDEGACCAPPAPATLDPAATTRAVASLRALGDPTRLGLMALLAAQREPVCVCDLVTHFALGQPTISHHLRVLRQAGLVDCYRKGTWAYYFMLPDALAPLQGVLERLAGNTAINHGAD